MPICALVGATDFNSEHFSAQQFDCIVAVDKGFAHLDELSVRPQIAIGDFDSLGSHPESVPVIRYPAHKDASDMELALEWAYDQGFRTMLVYGALAERLDHTIANLAVFDSFSRRGCRIFGIGETFAATVICGEGCSSLEFLSFEPSALDEGAYGRCISAFPLGGSAQGVCERGLKYSLEDAELVHGSSLGLSNEFTGAEACISVKAGSVLAIFSLGAWNYVKGE